MTTDKPMGGRWRVIESVDTVALRVDLWNGHGLTLTVWKDGGASPFVALRSGQDEHDLADATATSFRRWLDGAQGKR